MTFPFSNDIIDLCASLAQYATAESIRSALDSDPDVLQFIHPPPHREESTAAPVNAGEVDAVEHDNRVVMVAEILDGSVKCPTGTLADGHADVQMAVTTNSHEMLKLLTHRCLTPPNEEKIPSSVAEGEDESPVSVRSVSMNPATPNRIPLSVIFITRKQRLTLTGEPLPPSYGVPLTVKDVCVQSIDVTRPLEVLQHMLEKVYEPMFRNKRYQYGIRSHIHDLLLSIQSLRHVLPEFRSTDYVEDELLLLCEKYPQLDVPQLVHHLGSQVKEVKFVRKIRQVRDRCLPVLQIEKKLQQQMLIDKSEAAAARFGLEIESVLTEKIFLWENVKKWVDEVHQQLLRREWALLHALLRPTGDTNFEREFQQHQSFIARITRYLHAIPDVRLESKESKSFYRMAESVLSAVCRGTELFTKLALCVLNEITVEIVARWVATALKADEVLRLGQTANALMAADNKAEGTPFSPAEAVGVLVREMEKSIGVLSESMVLFRWMQKRYSECHHLLQTNATPESEPQGGAAGTSSPSSSTHPHRHTQLDALYQRCMEIQNFMELHTLRVKQLEHVFMQNSKFRQGVLFQRAHREITSMETGEVFVQDLHKLYMEFVESMTNENDARGGSVLWGTSPRCLKLFEMSLEKYNKGLSEVDERLARFVSELLAHQYNHQQVNSDGLLHSFNSTQFLRTFTLFRFVPLDKLKQVLRGYQQPVEEQLERLAVHIRDEYFNVELAKKRDLFARTHYGVSKLAAAVVTELSFEQRFRECYDTRDFLSEKGWHQLLSLRNHAHHWRLNDSLADFFGFPLSDLSLELQPNLEVNGCAYALSYLEQLYPNEEGWQKDPHLHVARELIKEKGQNAFMNAQSRLILLGVQKNVRADLAKTRDLHSMHATCFHSVNEKANAWLHHALRQLNSFDVHAPDYTLKGPLLTVVDVTRRPDALVRRQRGEDTHAIAAGAKAAGASTQQLLQIEVAFPSGFPTLSADVRYMESVRLPITHTEEFSRLRKFVNNNERRHQLAVCLSEMLCVYYSAINGEDETIALLASAVYQDVNMYLKGGFDLHWEDETEVMNFVNVFRQLLPVLITTVQAVREQSEVVYSKIQRLHSQAYHPEAISQTVNDILTITTTLSVECVHAHLWVQRVQPLLDAALLQQLRYLFHGWTKDFLSMRDDLKFLELSAETEVFHLRPLRLHMVVVMKQVRLESSAPSWRRHWLQRLDEYFRWVHQLPRLYSDSVSHQIDESDLNTCPDGEKGYPHLLLQLPPYVLEEPLKVIERCIQETIEAEQEWQSSQQFLNIDVNVMQQRFGTDLRRWSNAIQRMHELTTQLMDMTQPNKLLGGIVICAEGVQNELSRRFDQVRQFALSKFKNVLEQELTTTSTKMKEEFNKWEALNVINNNEDAIEFLCEVPRIKKEMVEQEALMELLVDSESTLQHLGHVFPENWLYAVNVQENYRSLKDLVDRRMKALHVRRPALLETVQTLSQNLEAATTRIKEQLDDIDNHPGRTPVVVQQMVTEMYASCVNLKKEAERVKRIQEALGVPTIGTSRIDHMEAEIATLREVWARATTVDNRFAQLGQTPFFEVQAQWLQEELQTLENELSSFPVSLKTFRVYQDLLQKVHSASALRRYMHDLRSDAMAPLERAQRHWIALKQRLGASWMLDRLTVNDIWSSDPLGHATIYNEVLEVAQGERRIEQQLSHMSSFWEAFQFSLTVYKKQTCLVRGWDVLFDKLADDLGTCSGMRASPFFNAPQLVSAVNEVEGRLNHLRQVMETLVEVQKHWVYLDGIFTGNNEIRLQLPHDTVQFERTTRELMTILPRPRAGGVTPEVGVQFFLQDAKLAQTLERMASQINAVQHALTAYLDGQRRRFPRFFFVGDDDLLEIMGNGTDPSFMGRHLRKMFTALAAFIVEPDTAALRGFSSVEGETVMYQRAEPIEVRDRPLYDWLSEAEDGMVHSLRKLTSVAARQLFESNDVTLPWMEQHPTQILCLALQLWWVRLQEKQLSTSGGIGGSKSRRVISTATRNVGIPKSPVTAAMDKLLAHLANNVLDTTLSTAMRHRCEQMITISVYQRDVSRSLVISGVKSTKDFDWSRVFRMYLERSSSGGDGSSTAEEQVVCCMADARILHGFEYTGSYERLVQTPLTDKCYFTLTQALHTRMGGSPVGPAGTGKTETVKALGMQLGRHVLVFNCDDTFDYQAVSRIFLGLCQVGAWGCFDEFNRLEERIMSALSLQIQQIQDSLRRQQKEVDLHTQAVPLNPNVAIFITMNPGYAGRSNLPGNLKQLFRTVTMTVPDRETIAEVMLFAQGFHTAEHLSRKIVPLFRLCDSQFSKQAHYDFGLRALKSVLVAAGKRKRAAAAASSAEAEVEVRGEESSFMLSCIMDNIAPKLITEDVALFYPLLKDFFPNQHLPDSMYKDIMDAVQDVCAECGLTPSPAWVEKICQLHSTKAGRHGIMMVGPSGTGKTMAWKVLMAATVRVDPKAEVHAYVIEPKVLAKTELFGSLDITTREWKDGVFSAILRRIIESEHQKQEGQEGKSGDPLPDSRAQKQAQHWIIFDGDVDPEWVENLNSVLDDNKILTLPNGERLALPPSVRIIFEVESLRYATPATVSRCGMLWFSEGVVPLGCVLTYAYQQMERKCIADARGRHSAWAMDHDRVEVSEDPKRGLKGVSVNRGKTFNQYIATTVSGELAEMQGVASRTEDSTLEGTKEDDEGNGGEAASAVGSASGSAAQTTPGTTLPSGSAGWRQDSGHPDARRIQSEMLRVLGSAFSRQGLIAKSIELVSSPAYRSHCIMELDVLQLLHGVFAILWEGMWRTFCAEQESGTGTLSSHVLAKVAEKLIMSAVVWGVGAPMSYEHRERLAADLHLEANVSSGGVMSILEVEVDYASGAWRMVRDRVKEVTILAEQVGANETVIPTVDTERHQDLLTAWIGAGRSAILCGPPGSGKTMSINSVLSRSHEYEAAFLNFSSGTAVDIILKTLEQYCTVRNTARGFVMSPSSDKKLLLFCDEINLPALDLYGTQTVLQLLRQLVECGGFFRARDNMWIHVEGVQIIGACNPPTDPGRIPLPHRFCRWAPVLFVDFPSEESLHIIYSTYCKAILHTNLNVMRKYADRLATAMVGVYLESQARFTPMQQPHYLYSPRELSRWSRAIYEGMLTWDESQKKNFPVDGLVRLAVHEGLRVFSDRLVTAEEREWTDFMVDNVFREQFPDLPSAVYERPMLFSTLLSAQYTETDSAREDLRALIEQRLQAFCEEEVSVPLVVFDSMVDHVVRLDRVLRQPLGHMLMAGASGVGKSMIARLAAWMRGYSAFWLKVHRDYDIMAFEEDLRALLRRSGCKGEKICFIFDESNIMQPSFLEYMNALLASGEVPGLFEGEEWVKLMQDIREAVASVKASSNSSAVSAAAGGGGGAAGGAAGGGVGSSSTGSGAAAGGVVQPSKEMSALPHLATASDHDLYHWFLQNVKEKLHVVFTINPSSAEFANRAVASPALFNRCTIDWFGDWDRETLAQIAHARLAEQKLITDEKDDTFPSEEGAHEAVVSAFCAIHECTSKLNVAMRARQANNGTFITPRHFTDLVSHFVRLFQEKCTGSSEQLQHLRNGLKKLDETSSDIEKQRTKLKENEKIIAENSKSAQEMLDRIVTETETTKKEKEAAESLRAQLQEEEAKIMQDKTVIENDLSKVEPALREAEAALNTVKPEHLREIRAYAKPPQMVQLVLEAVVTLMGESNSDWDTLKGYIRRDDFLSSVKAFKPTNITDKAHEAVQGNMKENLKVEAAYRASKAAGPLLQWVFAQVDYVTIYKKLRPLQERVEELTKEHTEKLQALQKTEKDIQDKENLLFKLKEEYSTMTEKIADLKHHISLIAAKCERATTILGQLLDEQSRWEEEVQTYDTFSRTKVGDCILSASFLSYIGFFDESVRENLLLPGWSNCLSTAKIPIRTNFNVLLYLVSPSMNLDWEQHGLPKDQLCAENAMIMDRTERYPLVIDPTGTAVRFLQSQYASQKISKASFTRPGYLKQLELAVRFGYPILLEDAEFLDPAVTPLLNQEFRQNGGRRITRVGPHDVDLSSSFKLFLLTRDPNYQPSPTLAGQTCIVNFTVTRSSLYSQCLHRIIVHERPDIDTKRSELLKTQGEYQLRLRVLEQKLLTTISEAEGSLLENDQLIATLATLKTEARRMQDDINNSDEAMQTIQRVESRYRPLSQVVSSTFFALKRFSELNPCYRYNVDFVFRVIEDALAALPPKLHNVQPASQIARRSGQVGTSTLEASASGSSVAPAGGDTPDSIAEEWERIQRLLLYVFNLIHRRVVRGMFMEDHMVLAVRLAQMRSSVHTLITTAQPEKASGADPHTSPSDLEKVYGVEVKEEEWEWLLQSLRGGGGVDEDGEAAGEDAVAGNVAFPSALSQLQLLPASKQRRAALRNLLSKPAFSTLSASLSNSSHMKAWEVFFQSPSPIAAHHELPLEAFPPNCPLVRRAFLLAAILLYTRQDDFLAATLKTLQLFFDGEEESTITLEDEEGRENHAAVRHFFGLHTNSVVDAMPELSSSTPLLMVSDANYDPSTSVEQLARQSGAVLRAAAMGSMESTSAAEKHIEEGMRTGCWVLLKNVHLAKAYVDQMEKNLHAHRLEGKVHSNFRLFLTAERSASLNRDSFLPTNLLEDCVLVVFEAPPGIKSSMLTTYGVLDKKKTTTTTTTTGTGSSKTDHHQLQRLLLAAAWVHAVLTERLFYVPLGWSTTYEFSDAEYMRVAQAVESWSALTAAGGGAGAGSGTLDVDWVALRAIVAETVYGGKVSNPFDQLVIDIFCEKVLNESLWKEGHILLKSSANAGGVVMPALQSASMSRHQLLHWVASLPDGSSPPQWLGLPDCVARVKLSQQAVQTLERLSAVQIALQDELVGMSLANSSNHSAGAAGRRGSSVSPRASAGGSGGDAEREQIGRWAAVVKERCESWRPLLASLEERYGKHPLLTSQTSGTNRTFHTASPTDVSGSVTEPLTLAVQREAEIASEWVTRLLSDVKALEDVVHGRKKPAALHRSLVDDLTKDVVPARWRGVVMHVGNLSLHPWMADVRARLEHVLQLADAITQKSLARTPIHLGLLFSPGGFLTAFKQHYARVKQLSLEALTPQLELFSAGAKPLTAMEGVGKESSSDCNALLFTGVTLFSAKVNEKDGKADLIETTSSSISALTTSVSLRWSWKCAVAAAADQERGGTVPAEQSNSGPQPQEQSIALRLRHQDASQHRIAIPLYASATREQLLDVLDIDIVPQTSGECDLGLWYERGVCLTAWAPQD